MKFKLLAILFGLCVSFLFVETGFRAFWPQEDIYLYQVDRGFVYNRLHFNNPHAVPVLAQFTRTHENGAHEFFKISVTTNSKGQRDDREPTEARSQTGMRILALGDSMTFGWPVEISKGYLKRLESHWPGSETINCGVIGASTVQSLQIFGKECSKYQVDVVIMQMTIHNSIDRPDFLVTDTLHPLFRVQNAFFLRWNQDPSLESSGIDLSEPELADRVSESFSPRLALYPELHAVRFIENFLISRRSAPMRVQGMQRDLRAAREDFATGKAVRKIREERSHPTVASLLKLREQVIASKAKLLVVFTATAPQARPISRIARPDLEALQSVLTEEKIQFLDLTRFEPEVSLDRLYYRGDYHPTALGYDWIALKISEKIKSGL